MRTSYTLLSGLISGLLLNLSFPPFNLSILIWVAIVPLFMVLLLEKKNSNVLIAASIAGIIFYVGSLHWLFFVFGLYGLLLALALSFQLIFYVALLISFLKKTSNKWLFLAFASFLWVALEFFRSEIWPLKFTWMNFGYSQHNFLPMLQFASVLGQYGISFAIIAVNVVAAITLIHWKERKYWLFPALYVMGILALILVSGFFSLKQTYSPDIPVVVVQGETSEFNLYANLSNQHNGTFILWPEYSIPGFLDENEFLFSQIQTLAQENNAYVIVGSTDRAGDDFYNAAYLFSDEGDLLGKYYKMNPIQFFSDGLPGKNFSVFETDYGRIGIFICYDADYSYVARTIVRNGAEILFIPTYDAMRWGEIQHLQHSSMTSMRAVENGRFVVRAASSGISQIIDPKGRTLLEIPLGESSSGKAFVSALHENTLYTSFGYLFSYFCILATIGLLVGCNLKSKN